MWTSPTGQPADRDRSADRSAEQRIRRYVDGGREATLAISRFLADYTSHDELWLCVKVSLDGHSATHLMPDAAAALLRGGVDRIAHTLLNNLEADAARIAS